MELSRFKAAKLLPLFLVVAGAQDRSRPEVLTPAVLENTGKPIQVPYRCTADDMQWAGMSCSEQDPCSVYLELTVVEALGNKLFTAGNIHSQTVTLYSILLGSEDVGRSWLEVHPRIRGAGFDHVQFADLENGWVSGEALSPLPQDPFLLITADGGKSWRQHVIFPETRIGSIQQIQFLSKKEGSLVIDRGPGSEGERYELYESPNAGQTWNVKEASRRPIQLKGEFTTPVLWRVQADGATKSFRIEHQQGGQWAPAAAFAVNLGSCAPPAPDLLGTPEPVTLPPSIPPPPRSKKK